MRRAIVSELIRCLEEKSGADYSPWGTDEQESVGTGFVIAGLPMFFSVLSFGDIPPDRLDVQIESNVQIPVSLGYDQYMINGCYSVRELIVLIEEYRKSLDQWPTGA
jgi:hypothetical protein